MAGPAPRRGLAHYAAPAAFLAAVTIAVLLIRSGLGGGTGTPATTTIGTVTHPTRVATTPRRKHKPHKPRSGPATYYTVQSGDSFGTIAAKEGTTVARLEQLNPGVSSSSLQVGQRLRVK